MKHIYDIKNIFLLSFFLFPISARATYDPTLAGYGTAVAYQGKHIDAFLDATANTSEGSTASPYGIVTTGSCLLNTSELPNYPTQVAQGLPSVSRFNRDGTKDTNFGNFFPGTGWYINDPSTGNSYPSLFPGSAHVGKLLFMNIAGASPQYFWLYRNGAPQNNFLLYQYFPVTGRLYEAFPQSIPIHNAAGNPIGGSGATITSACTVQISGTTNTTSVIYVTYYDASGNSYIAALQYLPITNSFLYDTTFATHGVIEFASGTGGATAVHFNSINYDSAADALIVAGSCTSSGSKVIIARYTMAGALDTSFNTTGYAILAAPGGTTPAVISQFIFAKIVSTGTFYYYLSGWDATPQLNICYLDPTTATFVNPGVGLLVTVGVTGSDDSYQIYDMVQIPDSSDTLAVAVAVGAGQTNPLYAGIINFQFEAPDNDWDSVNSVAITDVDASAIDQTGGNLAFYSCLYDPTLYAASPIDLPGVFVGGNFGTNGCFINYTYGSEPAGSTTTYGMIPNPGVGSGVGFFDYVTSTYPGGFVSQQVFYSDASGSSAYYVILQGLKAGSDSDLGIARFDVGNNSFDYTFGGTGNPFCLVAADVAPAASALDDASGIMYTAGVATSSTSFSSGDLVLTAFDLTFGSVGLVPTFTRTGQTDDGIIPYDLSSPIDLTGGSSYAQLDLALQNISSNPTKLIVAGTNDLLQPGFVARFNTIPTLLGDGILDLSFGATNLGYNLFNPAGDTYLSSCAVDTADNVVVAGAVGGSTASTGQLVVARYTPDGILDTNFGPAPQVGYGYFSLLGLSGTDYAVEVHNIEFDPATNMYFVGKYTAPLVTTGGSTSAGTSPFISRLVSLGVQDSTFYNNYGTFLIPLQYVDGAGNFDVCLYDIAPVSNLSSGTMYAVGFIDQTVQAGTEPFATLIRFSIQGLNLSTSQALNSGNTSTVPPNIQGNICTDLVVPPIYFVAQISSPQGPAVYIYNNMKTSADMQNALSLAGIVDKLQTDLIAVGANAKFASAISTNFNDLMVTLINNFIAAYKNSGVSLLTNILSLSQAIATNECLLISNGSLVVSDTNQLQAIYGAETTLQSNIKTAASYCLNTLVSPFN